MLAENRRIFNRLLISLGYSCSFLSPNTWTFLGLLTGMIAVLFIFQKSLVLGTIFLLISSIIDVIDGSVAKVCKKSTDFGAVFDRGIDKYLEGLTILAISLSSSLFWGFLAMFGSILISSISSLGQMHTNKTPLKLFGRAERLILILFGLSLAASLGEAYLLYTLIALAFASHITALVLFIHYLIILKER